MTNIAREPGIENQDEGPDCHLFVRDFPEDIKRMARAMAIMQGTTFRSFVEAALIEHTRRVKELVDRKLSE